MDKKYRLLLTAGVLIVCIVCIALVAGHITEPDADLALTVPDGGYVQADITECNMMPSVQAFQWAMAIGAVLIVSLAWVLSAKKVDLPLAAFLITFCVGAIIVVCKPAGMYFGWDEETHANYTAWAIWNDWDSFKESASSWIVWDVGYLPYIVGGIIGKLFGAGTILQGKLSMLFGVLAYAGMAYAAVRITPKYKMTFLCASALPICCFQASCYTYDTMVIAAILVGMALLVRILCGEGHREKEIMACAIVLTIFTLPKPVYSLCLLLLWMIPAKHFAGKRSMWLFRAFILILTCWSMLTLKLPGVYDNVSGGDARFSGTDSAAQIRFILSEPLAAIQIMGGYFIRKLWYLETNAIAYIGRIGNDDVFSMIFLYLLLASGLCMYGEEKQMVLNAKRRTAFIGMNFVILLALIVTQYIVSSEVGGKAVQGMQPRYSIPIAILYALALMPPEKLRNRLRSGSHALAIVTTVLISAADLYVILSMMAGNVLHIGWA